MKSLILLAVITLSMSACTIVPYEEGSDMFMQNHPTLAEQGLVDYQVTDAIRHAERRITNVCELDVDIKSFVTTALTCEEYIAKRNAKLKNVKIAGK